jgi:hypothetical protein
MQHPSGQVFAEQPPHTSALPASTQRSPLWHFMQRWPFLPHELLFPPSLQFPSLSRQPAQTQSPFTQVSPSPQRTHWSPFAPQARAELPVTHSPAEFEHPPWQTHFLFRQTRPRAEQLVQTTPSCPHRESSVPGLQTKFGAVPEEQPRRHGFMQRPNPLLSSPQISS